MFCPKCGLQNVDESKFCRGCGADLSNVLAVVDGKPREVLPRAEKHIELFSQGIKGLMLGLGFLIVSGLAYAFRSPTGSLWLFMLAFAFVFLSSGVSRFIQARGIKALGKGDEPAALPPGQTEYIKPRHSIYETDELLARPLSVTEHTTTHLEMDPDGETFGVPKK